MEHGYMSYPFYIAGRFKIVHDLLLFDFAEVKTNKTSDEAAVAAIDSDSKKGDRHLEAAEGKIGWITNENNEGSSRKHLYIVNIFRSKLVVLTI